MTNEDGEPNEEPTAVVSVLTEILPNAVFVLDGKDDDLVKRVRELTEKQLQEANITPENMDRRLKFYREKTGNKELETGPVQQYFQEQNVEEVPIDVFKDGQDEDAEVLFERLTTNVEGGPNGRPFNWLTSEEEIEAERARREANSLLIEEEKTAQDKLKMEQRENEERGSREKQAKERKQKLEDEERDALNNKSIALRN